MHIFKIDISGDSWIIYGTFKTDNDDKKIYLFGEENGIPIIKNIENYLEINGHEFVLNLPLECFNTISFNGSIRLQICEDIGTYQETEVNGELVNCKKKIVHGLFSYDLYAESDWVGFFIQPIILKFRAMFINIEDKNCNMVIDVPEDAVTAGKKCEIFLSRRMTETLWQYSDKDIFLTECINSGNQKIKISLNNLLIMNEKNEWYDFKVKVVEGNKSAKYFLKNDINSDINVNDILIQKKFVIENRIIDCKIYKSGGKNLSVAICSKNEFISKVEKFQLVGDKLLIHFTKPNVSHKFEHNKKISFVLKKRTYSNMMGSYYVSWKKELEESECSFIFEEKADEILKNYVYDADEFWDAFIEIKMENKESKLYSVQGEEFKSEYFDAAGGFKICFFTGSDNALAVYTHEGNHYGNNKIKICVVGTCFSRSVFRSEIYFNPDYKRFYDCVLTQFHSSLISLASDECKEKLFEEEELTKEEKLYLPTEINKDFFYRLRNSEAEYLLLDNYVDATRPIVEIEQGVYVTYNVYFSRREKSKRICNYRMIPPGTEEYYSLFKIYAKKFIDKIKEVIPENHIILLEGRFSYYKYDEKTNIRKEWENKPKIYRNNIYWDKIDALLLEIAPKMRIINMRNSRYVSDVNSPIPGGASISHYEKYYYREILDKINKIVLEDKLMRR